MKELKVRNIFYDEFMKYPPEVIVAKKLILMGISEEDLMEICTSMKISDVWRNKVHNAMRDITRNTNCIPKKGK